MIRVVMYSMALLTIYAIFHRASDHEVIEGVRPNVFTIANAAIAKIAYPLCLLVHGLFISYLAYGTYQTWNEDDKLPIAMAFYTLGPLAIIALLCSLAFLYRWFDQPRRGLVRRATLHYAIYLLIFGIAVMLIGVNR